MDIQGGGPNNCFFGHVAGQYEILELFGCRRRNGVSGAHVSEHGHANALDVRSFKLMNGEVMEFTDARAEAFVREKLRDTACSRFSTVLGNGADAYHDTHVHIDLMERNNHYKICQWDVLDDPQTGSVRAEKAATAAAHELSSIPCRALALYFPSQIDATSGSGSSERKARPSVIIRLPQCPIRHKPDARS